MMKTIHSYWAYIVLIVLMYAVAKAILGCTQKKQFTDKDLRIGLFALIVSHIQLLIGLVWYFISPGYKVLKADAGAARSNRVTGLLAVENPTVMILAVVLITIGWSQHKKKDRGCSKI